MTEIYTNFSAFRIVFWMASKSCVLPLVFMGAGELCNKAEVIQMLTPFLHRVLIKPLPTERYTLAAWSAV